MAFSKRSINLPVRGQPADAEVWYAHGLRFACTQCGHCCSGGPGYVWLTTEDMARIAAVLQMPLEQFTRTHVRQINGKYSLIEQRNYDCVFLTRDGGRTGCRIYPVRPTQCRTWPFWQHNLRTPDDWSEAAERCPGMCDGSGPVYDLTYIEERRMNPESP